MANPPPNRPWFRLASIARPAPPMAPPAAPAPVAPAPAPVAPAPASAPFAAPQPRPAFTNIPPPQEPIPPRAASVPTSPVNPAPASLPSSPLVRRNSPPSNTQVINAPSSPSIKTNTSTSSLPSSPATNTFSPPKAVVARGVSPKTSPIKTIQPSDQWQAKTPPRSPLRKPIAPPSPLVLPPAHAETKIPPEAEQKTVLVQKTIERNHQNGHNKHGNNEKQVGGEAKERSVHEQETGMRVITIAGENRGAYMELIHSPTRHAFGGNPHSLVNKGASSGSESDTSNNNGMRRNGSSSSSSASPQPMRAFTNSNVQGINNSIVFNASCKDNNPGVHLTLSRKPSNGNGIHIKKQVNEHHLT